METHEIFGRFESIGSVAQMAVLVAAIGFLLFEAAGDVRVSVVFTDAHAKLADLGARMLVGAIFGIHFVMFTTWFLLAGIPVSYRLLADCAHVRRHGRPRVAANGHSIFDYCVRNALRRKPTTIVIGEARDKATIEASTELGAANTHAVGYAKDSVAQLPDSTAPRTMNPSGIPHKGSE
jgi:hypothetical protein